MEGLLKKTMSESERQKESLLELEQLRTENLKLQKESKDFVVNATPGGLGRGNAELEKSKKEIVLDLKQFNEQDEVIKNRVILYTVKLINGSTQGVEKIHIRDIVKLCNNNIGNKYLTPTKNIKILVKNRKVFFISLT